MNKMTTETRVYQSSKNYNVLNILKKSLVGYKESFYLAKQLAKRDIHAQYRQSVLGIFWAIAPVLMNATVWIFLKGTGTIQLSETNVPYPLFVVIGTSIWSVFGECLLMSINSVNANKSIITKINFQKEALVSLGIIKLMFNVLIKLALIIALMLVYQVPLSFSVVWFIPILLISMLSFISVGVFLTPIGILYNDISRIVPIIMQGLMYVTPVVYIATQKGIMKSIMDINPLTYILTSLRNTLTGYSVNHIPFLIVFTVCTILLILLAMIVYRISMPIIAERMSA